MMKDVEFSCMQKVMISSELISEECFFQPDIFREKKIFACFFH